MKMLKVSGTDFPKRGLVKGTELIQMYEKGFLRTAGLYLKEFSTECKWALSGTVEKKKDTKENQLNPRLF